MPLFLACSYGYRQLIEADCADILQPDITWMGGITEVLYTNQIALRPFMNFIISFRLVVWLPWQHHMTLM